MRKHEKKKSIYLLNGPAEKSHRILEVVKASLVDC